MKNTKSNFGTLTLALFTSAFLCMQAQAGDPPPAQDIRLDIGMLSPPQLGSAYHSDSQNFSNACVQNPGGSVAQNQQGSLSAQIQSSTEDATASLGVQAGGRYSTGITTTSVSAEFARSTIQSRYTVNLIYKFVSNYIEEFNEDGSNSVNPKTNYQSLLSDPRNFYVSCGDEYVSAMSKSAQILVNLSVQFASKQEAQSFSTSFKLESPMLGISAALQDSTKNVSKNTKMTFNSVQIGGSAGKSGKAVCPSDILGTGHSADPSCSDSMVQCGFGSFDQCIKLFEKIVNYSAGDFSDQIVDKTTGRPQNYVVSAVHVQPYVYAGAEYPQVPAVADEQTFQEELSLLNGYFEQYLKEWVMVNRIITDGTPRLSDRQRNKMAQVELELHDIVNDLVTRIDGCYDHGYTACATNSGASFNAALDQKLSALKTVFGPDLDSTVQDKLDIAGIDGSVINLTNPETFAQYCDLADDLNPGYKSTVESLKAIVDAKLAEQSGNGHSNLGQGDSCENYAEVLNGFTELDFSKPIGGKTLVVGSLEPIATLKSLTRLNLSGQGIQDVTALQSLTNLTDLNLNNNAISNVCGLNQLPKLTTLGLQNQNNQLTTVDCLKNSANLTAFDARGNGAQLNCPLKNVQGCKLMDFSKAITAFKRSDAPSFHIASKAVAIAGGKVLVTGGLTPANGFTQINTLSLCDQNHCNDLPTHLNVARANHTLTALPDGRVLASGGYTDQLEIISPASGFSSKLVADHLDVPTSFHTATLLPDGRVLIIGGYMGILQVGQREGAPSNSYVVFNPKTEKIEVRGKLLFPRAEHTATLLKDGRVLVLGGFLQNQSLSSAEIIDLTQNTSTVLPNMQVGRFGHTAESLPDGRVLIVGGYGFVPANASNVCVDTSQLPSGETIWTTSGLNSIEVFDPLAHTFTLVSDTLSVGRGSMLSQVLSDGRILLMGGTSTGQLYNFVVSNTATDVSPDGGCDYHALVGAQSVVEIFDPATMGVYRSRGLSISRSQSALAPLDGNTFLVIGGMGSNESPQSSEVVVYSPPTH